MAAVSVFMSSTSRDLRDHRAAVREALLDAGYHPVDMADFGARAEGARTACLDEVAEADLFLGIYAWRYGFMPEGSPVSITEQEFDEARRLGKPCFCFVGDEAHEWPAELREEAPGADQLKAFKARIDAELVRTTFTNPDNLSRQVLSSLNRWEKGQHKLTLDAASALLSGPQSIDDAKQMVADVLAENEIEYTYDERSGFFEVPHGTTILVVEVFTHDRLGLMVDFRASLAQEVDIEAIPADVAANLLELNWNVPLGAAALDANSASMWYRYSLPGAMLSPESVFTSMTYVVTTADDLDEDVSNDLPIRARKGYGGKVR
jgi:hypothetical protein